MNIRDSITEAILSMSQSLITLAHNVKDQRDMAKRQIDALTNQITIKGKANKAALLDMKQNPKYSAYSQQYHQLTTTLHHYNTLINLIFNSIYIHRSKDFSDDIRIHVVPYLPNFLFFDLSKIIKQEYLKYLGWLCNDYASNVRYIAIDIIQQLLEQLDEYSHGHNKKQSNDDNEEEDDDNAMDEDEDEDEENNGKKVNHKQVTYQELSAIITPFINHFLNRFIQIANGDIDQDNSLLMIQMLRKMQK